MTSPESIAPVLAALASSAIIAIASTSSTIRIANTTWAKCCFFSLRSSSALIVIVVEEIDSIAPRNSASMTLQSNARPTA